MKYWIKLALGKIYNRLRRVSLDGRFQLQIRQGLVKIGRHSYGVPVVHSWPDGARLIVGNFTSIADEVHILLGGDHPTHWVSTFPLRIKLGLPGAGEDGTPSSKGDVVIGSDVWIGLGATILSGVRIGDGAIIMARSVIVKDVEPYAIVGGVPGKMVKKRFAEDDIVRLQDIQWWDWPDEMVTEATPLLSSGDLKAFFEAYGLLMGTPTSCSRE